MAENIFWEYYDFLDDELQDNVYRRKLQCMIKEHRRRLIIDIDDVRKYSLNRAKQLISNYTEEEIEVKRAIKECIRTINTDHADKYCDFFVGLCGSFGGQHVGPRTLRSKFLSSLVCLEGVVARSSEVKSILLKSVHYCPATKIISEHVNTDFTSPSYSFNLATSNCRYPTHDDNGNILETEHGLSVYKDRQVLTMQESCEKAPTGNLSQAVEVLLENDLVGGFKSGDKLMVVGCYRSFLPTKGSIFFNTMIIANNVILQNANFSVQRSDITMCRKLVEKEKDYMFELLANSIAPSLHVDIHIKNAILCLLLGGVEITLPNNSHIRGDIHILLIGDPSVAKSQLLRCVLHVAPFAVGTTGRGSTGVGLTAAVTTNRSTGGRHLEAGAMVLADRGVVCIDEFDKISDIDRVTIHEAMEQGKVSISKAGIHAKLNARCSVLAAANPLSSYYDQRKTPRDNIRIQDSLLSRFDLMMIMLDVPDRENDILISDHVVRIHRYRDPLEQEGEVLPLISDDVLSTKSFVHMTAIDQLDDVYDKYDPLLHGPVHHKILKIDFVRKYLAIAKCTKPQLDNAACGLITEEYTRLRSREAVGAEEERTMPVTPRSVESMIRISQAHAKARISRTVEAKDVQFAIQLINLSYFQTTKKD